jgi:2-haloacid dehalogenase
MGSIFGGLVARLAFANGAGVSVPSVLVFDVTNSLLNIDSLSPLFLRIFGDARVVREWFGQTILYAESASLTGSFTSFSAIGDGVLRMLGGIHRVPIAPADIDALHEGLAVMPPHPDVPDGLHKLKQAGFRLVTLTDSAVNPDAGPLKKAGLDVLFDRQFSAEAVLRFKPARETYRLVSEQMRVPLASMCMVTAHTWDLIGAQQAGCSGALIARGGVAPLPAPGLKAPQIVQPTLTEVAAALVSLKQS